jgi:hypothetical protein
MPRARLVAPIVVVCALVAATPALALPHLSKAQSRSVSNIVERWVNDVIRGRNLADGWKIAGAAERGSISHKAWVSGRYLPVMQMRVRNNPRTAWYATGRSGNELFLVVSLLNGRGKNKEMVDNETTLLKRHGKWQVYAFYADGIIRLGPGHSGSCNSSKCKVTGIADFYPGGANDGSGATDQARIGGAWGGLVVLGIVGLPVLMLLTLGVFLLVRSVQARRARIAYEASRVA